MADPRRAVFLDRDGVLNRNLPGYVRTVADLEILDVGGQVRRLADAGYMIVVVTNQSAINRGLTTRAAVGEIHAAIRAHVESSGGRIDAFYYCPHRPDEGCPCRKPRPGMLVRAREDHGIDPASSWLVGDSPTDIGAADAFGCRSVLIRENSGLDPGTVDRILGSRAG